MTQEPSSQVTVRILDRDYHVACPPEEREALLRAADYLSAQMAEIRDSGRVVGMDRIAVMVALNLTHQFLQSEQQREDVTTLTARRLERMRLTLLEASGEKETS